MKKFQVKVDWSGYSRGYSIYEVYANNKEDAARDWCEGEMIDHIIVRDDLDRQRPTASDVEEMSQ